MNFCRQQNLVVMETRFKKRKTNLYALKSLGNRKCYQIDYILESYASTRDVKILPGVYTASNHKGPSINYVTR